MSEGTTEDEPPGASLTPSSIEGTTDSGSKIGSGALTPDESAASAPRQEAVYDEMVTGTGRVRPYWRPLMSRLSPLDAVSLEERRDEAAQLLRQHGATYAVYGDPKGVERPWPLDLVPLLIAGDEWRIIEAGVKQRISLLNSILTDAYGPQQLVKSGVLPAAMLHANPGYLRACHDVKPLSGTYLHFSALDLARAPDGGWRVLADRTQAPSGAGYALENRGVVGRVLADCVGDGTVQPLAPFFAAFHDSLNAMTPVLAGSQQQPRIVLLTSGPYNETYFEHVYLAHQLGITLAEGNDLTVRNRQVFLKTLSGLEPVGTILRRMDDDFCDPLELRPTSRLGIPGLTEAVRAGTVVIANALGSGLMEAAAFKPLIADLARTVLGSELILPDVRTWWCGRPDECRHVLDHLDTLIIKPAFPAIGAEPVFGGELSKSARETLAKRIAAQPTNFVGQENIPLSTAPVWNGQRLEPRPVVLRVFVAATDEGFAVMPGGLTRTSQGQGPIVSMQHGGGSKDTWVVGAINEGPQEAKPFQVTRIVPLPQTNLRRPSAGELPSRVADSLFWLGRYLERSDGVVRLLRTLLTGVTDAVQPWRFRDAEPILNFAAWLDLVPLVDQAHSFQPVALTQAALLDATHPGGVIANIQHLLGAARSIRDRLPPDCWRVIMAMDRHTDATIGRAPPVRLLLRLEELVTLGAALSGAIGESMQRDAGWRFLEIGRRLERALYLVTMMRGISSPPQDDGTTGRMVEERRLLAAILALTDSRANAGDPGADQSDGMLDRSTVLRSVLANEADPRSLIFHLTALGEHLAALPRPSDSLASNHGLVELMVSLAASARAMVPEAIDEASRPMHRSTRAASNDIDPMRNAFRRLDVLLPEISDLLTQAYFTHALVRSA